MKELEQVRTRASTMLGPAGFRFLNIESHLDSPADWNNPLWSKLWLYNLHYFDDLNALGAAERLRWHQGLVDRWVQENPPTYGNGWEPYPTSLRIVNWVKWDLRTGGLDERAMQSLALQLRWLRSRLEYHVLGNHLLANAKALMFGGLYFAGFEADEWLGTGLRIFAEQVEEQILPDGGHFELSPMYHLIVLEDVLDVINVSRAHRLPRTLELEAVAGRMLGWAEVMRHPDGDIPFFNDAAFGVAGTYEDLHAYATRVLGATSQPMGEVGNDIGNGANVLLSESGYARLTAADAVGFFDVARVGPDYLPGHAHADTLSVELSLFGTRVLVNSGTSMYGESSERLRQRGTLAHNTVLIGGHDSSEVWRGFRVARRARVSDVKADMANGFVAAQHDGYRRLRGRPVHRRSVQLAEGEMRVVDSVTSEPLTQEPIAAEIVWHLHPDVVVTDEQGETAKSGGREWQLRVPTDDGTRAVTISVVGADNATLESSTWHPEFGVEITNLRIRSEASVMAPRQITTVVRW